MEPPTEDLGEMLARAALEGHKGNMRIDAYERANLPEALKAAWSRARSSIFFEADRGMTDFDFEFKSNTHHFCPTVDDVVTALPLELWKMRNDAKRGYAVHVSSTAPNQFQIKLSVAKRTTQLIQEHRAAGEAQPAPKRRKSSAP